MAVKLLGKGKRLFKCPETQPPSYTNVSIILVARPRRGRPAGRPSRRQRVIQICDIPKLQRTQVSVRLGRNSNLETGSGRSEKVNCLNLKASVRWRDWFHQIRTIFYVKISNSVRIYLLHVLQWHWHSANFHYFYPHRHSPIHDFLCWWLVLYQHRQMWRQFLSKWNHTLQ